MLMTLQWSHNSQPPAGTSLHSSTISVGHSHLHTAPHGLDDIAGDNIDNGGQCDNLVNVAQSGTIHNMPTTGYPWIQRDKRRRGAQVPQSAQCSGQLHQSTHSHSGTVSQRRLQCDIT
eukprot:1416634-Amphidinium_carterae.2